MKVIILYHKWGNKTMNTVFKVLSYVERELIRPIRHAERLNKPRGNLYKEEWIMLKDYLVDMDFDCELKDYRKEDS